MTKIELNKKEYIKALNVGGTFAGKSKLLPILDCVKIKVSNNKIKIVSSDGQNAINKSIEVVYDGEECTFCVNYKDLLSYVRLISADNLSLVIENNEVDIQHKNGNMKLPLMNADEFPVLKLDEDSCNISVSSALVNNWIVDGRNFIGSDDLRPIMCGIYFYSKDGEFGCCASDGRYLFTDNVNENIEDFEFVLNKNAFSAVCDVCSDVDEITIKIGNNNVIFVGNGISVLARKQEGKFPNFKSIINPNTNINVKADKKEMIDAINRCKLGSSSSCLIKFDISGLNMNITAEDIDFNKSANENVSVESNGNIIIGFNAENILKILNIVYTEKCIMKMSQPSNACIITDDNSENNKLFLLMPMMID